MKVQTQNLVTTAIGNSVLRLMFLLLVIFNSITLHAQESYTFSGIITSRKTGEKIIGANVRTQASPFGVLTNADGFFSLTLPKGVYTFYITAVGYHEKVVELSFIDNIRINYELDEKEVTLDEVTVTSKARARSLNSPQMGVERLSMQTIKNIPLLLGERDVLKAVQLLPGVKSAGDGSSGFYVRGGSADQNLILLDGAPVYNASHLLGFFSTFNADVVKDVTLYKGGMPAQFGGRLSSVLDIKMNEGNSKQYNVAGGIGLISSRLNIEGPLKENTSSFLIAGRRTYADVFLKLSKDSLINQNRLYFYDLNLKMNYKFGKNDHLYISGYFGRDALSMQKRMGLFWGNKTASARWNHIYSSRLSSNTSFIFSNYHYEVEAKTTFDNYTILSQLQNWVLKHDMQWSINNRNIISVGVSSSFHDIRPGEVKAAKNSGIGSKKLQKRYSLENAAFISNTWKPLHMLSVSYGLRATAFSVLGGGDFYNIDDKGSIIDTLSYNKNEVVKTYLNAEPRLMISYKLSATTSIKGSYTRNVQNLHLISNSTTSNPTDKWVSSSNIIKPEIADQYAIGYYKDFANRRFELSIEAYYKDMQNQIDYRNGANVYTNDAIETQLLFGKGRAYGVEWMLKKAEGRFTGWISYTLSKTERRIPGINNNEWYKAKQNRTHDFAVVGMLRLNSKWTVSANWVYYTGDAVTFPAGKYLIDEKVVFYYTKRNDHRMPAYHRLDLGATLQLKKKGRYSSELTFSLYNAYGKENAYDISFRESESNPGTTEAVQTTLFKYIPSISYNFKF